MNTDELQTNDSASRQSRTASDPNTLGAKLRLKDIPALRAEVLALQKSHFGLRMQKAAQQLNNNATLPKTRRDIARAKTILAEKLAAK